LSQQAGQYILSETLKKTHTPGSRHLWALEAQPLGRVLVQQQPAQKIWFTAFASKVPGALAILTGFSNTKTSRKGRSCSLPF
jgi:hypothetical protein